ncbi:hypothetical protein CPC08DRAFT_823953 [Agrocybe pediades]|nr:hypothetical protein CPC08DRAFT_823953 [Agrocybe pediades]
MSVPTINVANLKSIKNAVIGNPLAKAEISRDELFVSTLVDCLNAASDEDKAFQNALRAEAAHVIASLSYGSEQALGTLLQANAPHAFLYAISHFTASDSNALRSAFSRGLRALASSIADVVGPSMWGLRPEQSTIRNGAQQALNYLFQTESLDIYLPLLISTNSTTAVATSTAEVIALAVRSEGHRRLVTEWLPPAERQREVKSKRGWEKTASSASAAPPWVVRQLLNLLGDSHKEKDSKLVEAVLSALAALAKENPAVANSLAKASDPLPLVNILAFTKSRAVDVQLAACLCVTHTLRASSLVHPTSGFSSSHAHHPTSPSSAHASSSSAAHSFAHAPPAVPNPPFEETCARTVMNVVNRMLAAPTATPRSPAMIPDSVGSHKSKTRACYILHYLVTDDAALCHAACDRGCLDYLSSLIQSIHPPDADPESGIDQWEESEPESMSLLREAALIALASLALCSDDIRRRITDELGLLPCISRALRFKDKKRHVGTRYAACQCVRAMSRAVAVLRTSMVDSGLGMDVFRIVMGQELGDKYGGSSGGGGLTVLGGGGGGGGARGKGKADGLPDEGMVVEAADSGHRKPLGEDRRVLSAALSAVCNIVNDFSPLRPIYLEEKLMPRLVFILKESDDPALRLNALWAVKNLVRKTSSETKRDIMSCLGWSELANLLSDADEELQEQAFNTLRNLAENEEGIAMVFRNLGPQVLEKIVAGLRSPCSDVVLQAAFSVANLVNGTHEDQEAILHYPGLLTGLQACLAEMGPDIRRPAVSCVLALAQANPRRRKEMAEAGIVGTLKRLTEWSGHPGVGAGHGGHVHSHSFAHSHAHPHVGMSLSPPVAGGHWGASRSPGTTAGAGHRSTSSTSSSNATAGSQVYGSWGGSGSLAHHHHSPSLTYSYATPHLGHHPPHHHHHHSSVASVGLGVSSSHRPHLAHHHHSSTTGLGLGGSGSTSHMALEDDKDVVQRARTALEWLEHGETYST